MPWLACCGPAQEAAAPPSGPAREERQKPRMRRLTPAAVGRRRAQLPSKPGRLRSLGVVSLRPARAGTPSLFVELNSTFKVYSVSEARCNGIRPGARHGQTHNVAVGNGVFGLPKADVLAGYGNPFVAEAKRVLYVEAPRERGIARCLKFRWALRFLFGKIFRVCSCYLCVRCFDTARGHE